jgi:pilus assembly protein Flp/PilA
MATESKGKARPRKTARLTPGGEENIMDLLIRFIFDEAGATAVEYALILSFIALAVAGGMNALGQALKGSYESSSTAMFGS